MHTLLTLALLAATTTSVAALEVTGGPTTINQSQAALEAKADAGAKAVSDLLTKMTACNRNNALYDNIAGACKDPVDPVLVKKMVDCNGSKQFYDQASDACQSLALPADVSAQATSTSSVLDAIINCNSMKMFYNSGTGQCQTAGGGTLKWGASWTGKGGYGVLVNCPAGYVVTMVCSSGHDANCNYNGKTYTVITCRQLTIQ